MKKEQIFFDKICSYFLFIGGIFLFIGVYFLGWRRGNSRALKGVKRSFERAF